MKTENPGQPLYRVQSLDRALDILDCFTFQNREMGLSEIVRRTGLHKSTAKRLTSNLTSRDYLKQDPQTKRYQLGIRLFELGGIVFSSFSLRRAAAHHMSQLHHETGATVLLGVMIEDHLVYLDKREGDGMIRISSDIGRRRQLHFGMLGMVLMAHLRPYKAEQILNKYPLEAYTPHSITDRDAFSLRLEKIRNEGYVLEREEAVEGIAGIAAPIRDYSRQVTAALGVAVPLGQVSTDKELQRIVDIVRRTSENISLDLGYMKI